MITYCQRCVTPSSHPRVRLGASNICSACQGYEKRGEVDWPMREKHFKDVVEYAKQHSTGYDCLIPVSGGKDSHWQVVTCLQYGLNPLTVTWKDPARLEIGRENLENLVRLGVDHIDYQINPEVEKRFLYKALVKYGVPGLPKHMALYNIPLKLAVKFDIPLIVWGENAGIEYGDIEDERGASEVDYGWLIKHGVTHGTSPRDWVGEGLTQKELTPYFGPLPEELEKRQLRAVYLGYYFGWDPVRSYEIARKHGFRAPERGPGYYTFDDVDSGFISIHHYLKWFKFGCTRLFDNLSNEIRHQRLTRKQAIDIIRERAPETPHEDINRLCEFLEISREHFFEIAEKFRNKDIWVARSGRWIIEGFLIPDWDGWECTSNVGLV